MAQHFKLSDYVYAHRGLWQREAGPAENTLAAYKAAADAGYGIEYDLRPSRDGVPILFHDPVLDRMTDQSGDFEALSAAELSDIHIKGSDETISAWEALLDMWPPALPLITEIKIDGATDAAAFARRVGERLERYVGKATLISFSHEAVAAMPKELMRGQLAYPISITSEEMFNQALEHGRDAGVDFICVWHEDAPRAFEFTSKNNMDLGVYTVRSPEENRTLLRDVPDIGAIIFEHYDPKAI